MKRVSSLIPGVALAAAVAFAASPAVYAAGGAYKLQTGSPDGTFQIDPVHSIALFTIGHLGVSEFAGRFDKVTGSFTVDSAHPGHDQVKVEIPLSSLDTNFEQRNKDLSGPDFFNAKQFPVMTFVSTRVEMKGKGDAELLGKLTLHGVTKPVRFHMHHVGAGPDPWGGYRSGYVATGVIHRSEFGMNYLAAGIGDAVKVSLHIEGKRQ